MQLNCDRYRFRRFCRSMHSFDWDSQYFSREEMISVPQLCAYIFAILFEFSGIFNRLFRLNLLYSHRNTALSIECGRTAFFTSLPRGHLMPAMSSEHMMVGPIENAISGRHAPMRLCLNSEMRWTNRHVACHHSRPPDSTG